MELQKILDEFDSEYSLENMFQLGLYRYWEGNHQKERIYLDEFGLEGFDLFLYLFEFTKNKINELMGDEFYICQNYWSSTKNKSYSKSLIRQENKLDITIPYDTIFWQNYIVEEEVYSNNLFYKENKSNIPKYIWGVLACHFSDIYPILKCNIFYLSKDLSKLVNIYDDRGMDIIYLK